MTVFLLEGGLEGHNARMNREILFHMLNFRCWELNAPMVQVMYVEIEQTPTIWVAKCTGELRTTDLQRRERKLM